MTAKQEPRFGIIYRNAWIYQMAMRLLYRSHYREKYKVVAEEIPAGSTVVDLCCGDAQIYPLLAAKGCKYIGLDINPRFVEWGREKGIDVRHWDIAKQMDMPEGDVVCIQSALYHFIPNDKQLVDRMLERARQRVIITEPVDNWTKIKISLVHKLAVALTQVHGREFSKRHTEASFNALFSEIDPAQIRRRWLPPRELIVVIDVKPR